MATCERLKERPGHEARMEHNISIVIMIIIHLQIITTTYIVMIMRWVKHLRSRAQIDRVG